MILFLTSSAYDSEEKLFTKNSFLDNLKKEWKDRSNVLYIASFPDSYSITDDYYNKHKDAYISAGLSIKSFDLLDHRNMNEKDKLLDNADVIILCGGHCLTEMAFFKELNLKEKLKSFKGIIIGTSAGSMNSAKDVYNIPELEGEAIDPDFPKHYEGLGLTDINILPHYFEYLEILVDGKNPYKEIAYEDSINNTFYFMPDGSYLYQKDNKKVIYGETYRIKDKILEKINDDNGTYKF